MTDLSRMKPTFFFTGINKFKSAVTTAILLVIVSFFIIGGCNNSNSDQVDARTIGSIDGTVVTALKQVLTLRNWQEGDPDGHIYLNGSLVATLTDAEQQAVNDAYQMGYIVALVTPNIHHILNMHDVLGLNPVFADNGTLDLLAFSREFDVSGIRYFILRPYQSHDGSPIPEDLNLDRVVALGDWAPIMSSSVSTAQVDLRETGGLSDLTLLSDSVSWTEHGTWPATPSSDPQLAAFTPDLRVTFPGSTVQAWSAHSTASNNDFYYIRTKSLGLTPTSTLGALGAVCNEVCNIFTPDGVCSEDPAFFADQVGVIQYTLNSTQPTFNISELNVTDFNPTTTTGVITTSSSLDHTFSENVSYTQDDGGGVGVTNSSTYSHSTTYSSPAVTTTAFIGIGPNMNNAEWVWFVGDSRVSTSSFKPNYQWIWEATPSTRAAGSITLEQGFDWFSYAYSCTELKTSTFIPVLRMAIPAPPLPVDCSINQDCSAGQVCSIDLSPAICVPQPCDEMVLCPADFGCVNEQCQPS